MPAQTRATYVSALMQSWIRRADLPREVIREGMAAFGAELETLPLPPWVPHEGPQALAYLSEADELFYGGAAGSGKMLHVRTAIPMPTGWKLMGDLVAGDKVFTEDGGVCRVVQAHEPSVPRDAYRLRFDDGTEIEACGDHRWYTETPADRARWRAGRSRSAGARRRGAAATLDRARQSPARIGRVRTTREIAATLRGPDGGRAHAIPVAGPLQLPDAALPASPYEIGLRLGSGRSADRVPPAYLRAGIGQRLAILQGLMDGAGEPAGDGVTFTHPSPDLVADVAELVVSVGWVARVAGGPVPAVGFLPTVPAFRSADKQARQPSARAGANRFRRVIACDRVPPTLMRCVSVDNPTGLFLCSRAMVPTHNSDLLLGLALTAHTRSLILRQEATQLQALRDRLAALQHPQDRWRSIGYGGVLDTHDGRKVTLSGCDGMAGAEKWRGNPFDLHAWDELPAFPEHVFRFVNAWNRSIDPTQRTRKVGAGNPPTNVEGEWVIRVWSPWLDSQHSHPAEPGELRWFAMIDGKDVEVAGPEPITHKSEVIRPLSRTFIPARLHDNPDLERTGYRAALQGLPEPLRSQLLFGDMTAGRLDDDYQLVPTAWVRQSMRQWTADGAKGLRMDAAAVDVARGGTDRTVLAKRYGTWVAPLVVWPGLQTPDGPALVVKVLPHLESLHMPVLVDVLGSAGGGAVDTLRTTLPSLAIVPVNFAAGSTWKDKTGRLEMRNLRAEAYYRLREALDPALGAPLRLPDDPELLSEICAVRWHVSGGRVAIEDKDDIKKRLGRSPDKADAVAMSLLASGPTTGRWLVPTGPASPGPFGAEPFGGEPPGRWLSAGGGGRPFMGV
jgi:hypothetical protein